MKDHFKVIFTLITFMDWRYTQRPVGFNDRAFSIPFDDDDPC